MEKSDELKQVDNLCELFKKDPYEFLLKMTMRALVARECWPEETIKPIRLLKDIEILRLLKDLERPE